MMPQNLHQSILIYIIKFRMFILTYNILIKSIIRIKNYINTKRK